MALTTLIYVEHKLPGNAPSGWFTSDDLDDPFSDYKLTSEGRVVRVSYELQEAERPKDFNSLGSFLLQKTSGQQEATNETLAYHGFLSFSNAGLRFTALFEHGRLLDIRSGGFEEWVPTDHDAMTALKLLAVGFSNGRTLPRNEVSQFIKDFMSTLVS
jgi:hypothetical protein